jgi:ring-1,2-phenylacetyl-CoA epoxidase subunit PaaD
VNGSATSLPLEGRVGGEEIRTNLGQAKASINSAAVIVRPLRHFGPPPLLRGRRAENSTPLPPLDGEGAERSEAGGVEVDDCLAVNGRRDYPRQERAFAAAASVPDPEIPCVTVADLGILRSVEVDGDVAIARLTPTYSGCPAVLAIELTVEASLRDAGFDARIERVMSPPWTTDWITEEGRAKLKAYGIAPPAEPSTSIRALFGEAEVACPKCGSDDTARISEFGSTACKALYRCRACAEPFDYFKCI